MPVPPPHTPRTIEDRLALLELLARRLRRELDALAADLDAQDSAATSATETIDEGG